MNNLGGPGNPLQAHASSGLDTTTVRRSGACRLPSYTATQVPCVDSVARDLTPSQASLPPREDRPPACHVTLATPRYLHANPLDTHSIITP